MENYNELRHYGIKGMKWGVRRSEEQLAKARGDTDKSADDAKKADMKNAVKNRRTLSDKELRERVERIKLEKQLKDLTEEEISRGEAFAKSVLSSAGKKVATAVVTGAALYGIQATMTGKFDVKELAKYMTPKPKSK